MTVACLTATLAFAASGPVLINSHWHQDQGAPNTIVYDAIEPR
jgi:hypothetical protein